MSRRRLNHNGMTLVELLVSLTVSGVIIVAVMSFVTGSLVNYTTATIKGHMLSDAQLALGVINNDILLSASADQNNTVPDQNAPGGTLLGWTANSSTLILSTAAEDSAGNILFADPAKYISSKNNNIYYLNNGTIYKRTLAASIAGNKAKTTCPPASATAACPADKQIIDNVNSFVITYYNGYGQVVTAENARSVELNLQLKQRKYKQDISVNYKTRTVFRNE